MKKRIASTLILVLLFTACATTTPGTAPKQKPKPQNVKEWLAQNRTNRGAVVGAIAGALLGAASGIIQGKQADEVLGRAVAGAAIGAAAGVIIGKHLDRVYAGRDYAIVQTGYTSAQGYIARVEQVTFDPPAPKPGQSAKLCIRYIVLGPDPTEALKVRVFRGLKYGDDYIFGAGPNEFVVPRGGGVVDSIVELTLPKKAPSGTYRMEAMLEDANGHFPQTIGTAPLYIAQVQPRSGAAQAAR